MERFEGRSRLKELKANILFALTLGWIVTLSASLHYFVMDDGQLWLFWLVVGVTLLFLGVAIPGVLQPVRAFMNRIALGVGGFVLQQLLAFVYFVGVVPLGVAMQSVKGKAPFYYWRSDRPSAMEGWIAKISSDEANTIRVNKKKFTSLLEIFEVFGHFVRNGQYILIPCLLMVLVIAVLAIFAQSSAIAPMIYTLF